MKIASEEIARNIWKGVGGLVLALLGLVCVAAIAEAAPRCPDWQPAAVVLSIISWSAIGLFGVYLNVRASWSLNKLFESWKQEEEAREEAARLESQKP